ncbi:magnesium chelatase subunit D [Novosphingobium sp. PASSN1]|uniref:magnesium chelatase subunit D n=1 Tax=Novosphingobium sp. PASSN1 TaxID=2015561 RepID=UPI000BDCC490|nr:magnesium chelatase subunit D [Novosphingobium sp. PASSN1]OYU35902.1 MAG: magnesium chelatase [Novosphingobium sp. PASSN1]
MTSPAAPAADDAALALRAFALWPAGFGGLWLRGPGPARDALVERLGTAVHLRRMPAHIDGERLHGGIDLAASLAAGRSVPRTGFLDEARGGVVIAPLAERITPALAGSVAQALDHADAAQRFGLVLLDDGAERDEVPPLSLTERVAFACDLGTTAPAGLAAIELPAPLASPADLPACTAEGLEALAAVSLALGVDSGRALRFAALAAGASARLDGRDVVRESDLAAAARLVLSPRATRLPPPPPEDQAEDETPPPPPPPEGEADNPGDQEREDTGTPDPDQLIAAAAAAIPPGLLEALADGRTRRGAGSGGGARHLSPLRGRPLAARQGLPRGGARLALIDTLRAAVPWQALRRAEGGDTRSGLRIMKDDVRVRRFEARSASVTIFAVDASGSAAFTRLAEAKGAVELLLAQAYVKRTEVALVAFRGNEAQLLLPPTRSLTRARRALTELPGGGGTPLAAGLSMVCTLGTGLTRRGYTPLLVVLTDGRGNIALDGSTNRAAATDDALKAGRAIAAAGLAGVVIDISPRPRPEAAAVAGAMRARYVPLPQANAATLSKVIGALT